MSRGHIWYLGETREEYEERVRREDRAKRSRRIKACAKESAEALLSAVGMGILFALSVPLLLLI